MAFKALGLDDRLVQGILATGFTAPTEIQARAIPAAVAGKDIIGCAQTGTGKTAAFTLPLLHRLSQSPERSKHIKALVLTPTRELAQQIEDAVKNYGRFLSIRAYSVYGGTNIYNQLKQLSRGVDILIATPGRLIDHLERGSADLSHVETLILDEADRMYDMGFIDDMRKIIARTPQNRQTLLFSATMSKEVRRLVKDIQKDPELIEVGERRSPATTVTQHFYTVNDDKKLSLLLHILRTKELDSVLVFSKTKVGAERVSNNLHKAGIKAVSIHSDRTQAQRQRALAGFKQGKFPVLVATDVAARGIDVEGISHVINYDIPTYAEDYIHRIGRTGRAQTTGDAITFVTRSEVRHVKKIEHFIGKRIEIKKYPDFDYHKVEEVPAASATHSADDEGNAAEPKQYERRERPRFERKERPDFRRDRRTTGGTDRRTSFRSERSERPEGSGNSTRRFPTDRNERSNRGFTPREGSEKRKPYGAKPFGSGARPEFRKRDDGFKKRNENFTPREGNFTPREEGGQPRDNGFVPKERSFTPREGGFKKREGNFSKRPSFGGERREGFGQRRDIFGPKKKGSFPAQKRDHSFKKQETFSASAASGTFGERKRHGGPDWRELLPGEQVYKKREHKVVRKMVSRKKKDS